jgi:acyl-CoA thioesterase FadM
VPGFVHREPVAGGDLDAFHHLNNLVFQRYFETAWLQYRSELGWLGDPFAKTFFGLVMGEFQINYRAPVRFDEMLEQRVAPLPEAVREKLEADRIAATD